NNSSDLIDNSGGEYRGTYQKNTAKVKNPQRSTFKQEKNNLKQELRDKVKELEQSGLDKNEKQEKINKLLTEHSEELEKLDQEIEAERADYRHLRDKLIERLCRPCQICPEKEQTKNHLKQKITYLFGL
ncbi:724_t:CDS:2, partial [Scutellospora calospora]